ncbi:hypothetical protein ZWY2020_031029 [Hordeum vulgare]|nr:hypothetical protein ZWY2020_031029 [Hordeum vulgare]
MGRADSGDGDGELAEGVGAAAGRAEGVGATTSTMPVEGVGVAANRASAEGQIRVARRGHRVLGDAGRARFRGDAAWWEKDAAVQGRRWGPSLAPRERLIYSLSDPTDALFSSSSSSSPLAEDMQEDPN